MAAKPPAIGFGVNFSRIIVVIFSIAPTIFLFRSYKIEFEMFLAFYNFSITAYSFLPILTKFWKKIG